MLNLSEYRRRPKVLADYLPWAALVGPGLVLNKDGSLQRSCRYRGPDLESAGPEQLMAFHARVNNLLRRFGTGWAIWFEAVRRPATDYPVSDFESPAAWLVDEERRAAFEDDAHHYESDFYLTLCWLPPADRAARAESVLIDDPGAAPQVFWQDNHQRFSAEAFRLFDLFETLMPEASWLSDDETLTYLHQCVSAKYHRLKAPDIPMYLDAVIADTPLTGGLAPQLGERALRVISVRGYPDATEPGLLRALDALGFAYRWSSRFLPIGKGEAERTLSKYRRQWFAKRKSVLTVMKETLENEPSGLVNSDADNKAADADAALQSLGADHVGFGYLTIAVAVMDEDAAMADEKARAVERVFNHAGFAATTETTNAVDAWLGTHPGNAYANVRRPLLHTLNLAHLAPLSAVWAGSEVNTHLDGPPLIMARCGTDTPFRLVTHQGDVGHTMIVGPTGAGKSVLLAFMALQFQRYPGAQTYVFDKGRSARAALLALGADAYDLSVEGDLAFQPLRRIKEDSERTFAQDWVLGLMKQEGVALTPDVKEAIWSALCSLSDAPPHQRTLTGLAALIQQARLRQALEPYTLGGPYGALLDADSEGLSTSHAALFEMEALMHDQKLAAPVLAYLFHRLDQRFTGAPTLLILDEAWVFLDHPFFAGRLRDWLKTLRKKNVSVVFATQSLADITSSSIAPALIENCPTRIFLPNPRAEEPGQNAVYGAFGLTDHQCRLIAQASPKRDYYLQCPDGNRLFDLELGPVALAFCAAGSKTDLAAIEETLARSGPDGFAAAWLAQRGLSWAADLLIERGGVPCAAE